MRLKIRKQRESTLQLLYSDAELRSRAYENVEPVAMPSQRNRATSSYRPVGERGEPYPDWVRALKGKAGVYTIRDADTHEVLYVGSSAGRLYDTLTRHFQVVRHEAQEVPMT